MHSSRMRTARPLTCSGGCLPLVPEVSAFGLGGVCLWSWEVSAFGPMGVVVVSQHALRQTPPVYRILDTRY